MNGPGAKARDSDRGRSPPPSGPVEIPSLMTFRRAQMGYQRQQIAKVCGVCKRDFKGSSKQKYGSRKCAAMGNAIVHIFS
jgi:hypothetical protein